MLTHPFEFVREIIVRGYFGIGSERISKAMNLGAVLRTAHAFNASFVFTLGVSHRVRDVLFSDTSTAERHVPLYDWATLDDMRLPKGCSLVGVELDDNAVDLPRFRHPLQAAYILGPEKGSLSPEAVAACDQLIKIPTKFCVNLSVAAAIVMYDRTLSLGGFERQQGLQRSKGPPPPDEWQSL